MITVSGLSYTYPGGDAPAVQGLAFAVDNGEVFGFLGPSGAGKSTTQKILIGLLQGYSGEVQLMGRSLDEWGPSLYEHIGVTFELPNHYLRLTGRENLDYFRSLYSGDTEEPDALLEMVGLGEDADKRVAEYSKGMQARLNFVRGLLNKPQLIFMDEPTAGLDPVNAANIKQIVRRLQSEGGIHLLPQGIINTAEYPRYVENMLGNLARHDISVITLSQGYEYVHLFDTGLFQNFLVNTVPKKGRPTERWG